MNAYEVRQVWCLLQVKLCDPCLSALKWFVPCKALYKCSALLTLLYCILLFDSLMKRLSLHDVDNEHAHCAHTAFHVQLPKAIRHHVTVKPPRHCLIVVLEVCACENIHIFHKECS